MKLQRSGFIVIAGSGEKKTVFLRIEPPPTACFGEHRAWGKCHHAIQVNDCTWHLDHQEIFGSISQCLTLSLHKEGRSFKKVLI
jgi:hypothetical protein